MDLYFNATSVIEKLEHEGYTDVRVCPIPPRKHRGEHTHDRHTVHIILTGGLRVVEHGVTTEYPPGSRVEFPAGTVHVARGITDTGTMITGIK